MQMKTFVALALASLAVATPTRRGGAAAPGPVCCNSVTSASDPSASAALGLLGVVVQDVNALVGLSCTSVNVIGNSATCGKSQTMVNCENNAHHNLISLGCVPITARRDGYDYPPAPPSEPSEPSEPESDDSGDRCCSQVLSPKNKSASLLLGLLGVVVQDVTAMVGLDCTSLTVIGNSATCGDSKTQVTCTDNSHGNLISLGCLPVTLRRRTPAAPTAGKRCCEQLVKSNNPAASFLLGLLGLDVSSITASVGLDCTNVNLIGNSATCGSSTTAVSCTDNSHGNLISLGCVPITL